MTTGPETTPAPLLSAGELEKLETAVKSTFGHIYETEESLPFRWVEARLLKWALSKLLDAIAAYRAQEAQLADLRAQVERQAVALKPFADAADTFEREYGHLMKPDTGCNIKFSALVAARAAAPRKDDGAGE